MNRAEYPAKGTYPIPKKNILVLSCMDLRLTDDTVDFLHFDNLENRYDHFILAGSSLLATQTKQHLFAGGKFEEYSHWNRALEDHINLAIGLHKIEDMYIIEHENCGAYDGLLDNRKVDMSSYEKEIDWHKQFSVELAKRVAKEHKLNVHCFFIDLRGNVQHLHSEKTQVKTA